MDNISQIISRSIGGYSIGSILSALLTFLICLIVVRLVLKLWFAAALAREPPERAAAKGHPHEPQNASVSAYHHHHSRGARHQYLVAHRHHVGADIGRHAGRRGHSRQRRRADSSFLFSHPFSLGDEIEVGGTTGTVREISLTHTKIETPDGQIVLQPNREMSSSKIINFTVLGRRRIVYKVTASYDAPTDEVKQACMDAVLAFPAVLKEPTPTVYLSNYGASSIEYTIRCWTAADAYWDTYFKMYERLRNTFAKHNVEMSYDHLNIHVVPEKQNEN